MIYLVTIIPFVLYAYFAYKFIRKYEYIHYALFALLAIIGASLESHNFLNEGFIGVSLFIIVMFTGVLASSTLKKRLSQVRAQYAIMGFIIISGHSLTFFSYLFEESLLFSHISIIFGMIVYLIFIPLFVTSFMFIRKRMGYKNWKKLHSFAYLGYIALFIHLFSINNSRQEFYIVLFSVYAVFKIIAFLDKYFTMRAIRDKSKITNSK